VKVVRETIAACARREHPDIDQAAVEAVQALKGVAPKDAVESMIAMQMIGIHSAAADSLRMRRVKRAVHCAKSTYLRPVVCRERSPLVEALDRTGAKAIRSSGSSM
jgi:hypothetical protein